MSAALSFKSSETFEKAKGKWWEVHDDMLVMAPLVDAILNGLMTLEAHGYTINFERGEFAVFRPATKNLLTCKLPDERRFKSFQAKLEPEVAAALEAVRRNLLATPYVIAGHQTLYDPVRRIDLLSPPVAGQTGEIKVHLSCMAIFYTIGCKISSPLPSVPYMPRDQFLGYVTEAERTVLMHKFRMD